MGFGIISYIAVSIISLVIKSQTVQQTVAKMQCFFEESPGYGREESHLTGGRGNPRESATESRLPKLRFG